MEMKNIARRRYKSGSQIFTTRAADACDDNRDFYDIDPWGAAEGALTPTQ